MTRSKLHVHTTDPLPNDTVRPAAGLLILVLWLIPGLATAQLCTSYLASLPKESRLFLYFPTADDSTFPTDTLGNISGINSQPLTAFTPANIDSDLTATAAQLRDRITEQVRDAYCEFSVQVIGSTAEPNPTGTNWQVVGIGGDDEPGNRFGRAQRIDASDAVRQDYARVWAEEFHDAFGGTGGALSSTAANLERWSAAIAGTIAHEAGHNYGLAHSSSAARTGEDAQNNHFLATGSTGLTGAQRVVRRHFSDRSFETLAYNLGLNTKTLSNWDFVNPNGTDATGLRIRLLSTAGTLSLTRVYNGSLSPWTNPTLTKQSGTQSFRGTTYNIFDLVFSTGKSWSGGASGVAPAGVKFHVGAGVDADAVVYDVVLTDAGGDMGLHPRMFGYGFGLADSDDVGLTAGTGFLRFFANEDDEGELLIEDLEVRFLPRPVSLEQMVVGGELIAEDGLPVLPYRPRFTEARDAFVSSAPRQDEVGATWDLPIAKLTDPRHIDRTIQPSALCGEDNITLPPGPAGPDDRDGPDEEEYCDAGDYLSLFPATSIYVTATVVDPNSRHFDPTSGTMVTGPLRTRLYAQFAGIVPDLNRNQRDDLLDIRDGAPDTNGNGVPDEVEELVGTGDWSVYAAAGATFPDPSGLDGDLSWMLGLDRHVTASRSIGFRIARHQFETAGDDVDATEVALRLEQSYPRSPSFRLFVGGGLGIYDLDPGDTETGFHVGVGAGWRLTPNVDVEIRSDVHELVDSDLDFATAHGALRVRF